MTTDLTSAMWFKSSYSGNNGGDCVEVGAGVPSVVPVRDSKDPHGPALTFEPAAWNAFITAVKAGEIRD
ncbi:DUF397 domain-containing protein [Streptomyces sp. 71268]|uniref:DUF397 domain-containing protein n=1 Tax=Streptomyces sp. 71268 TaxID=3002640 RepID=UPI0023F8C779|nr:DUF397 domain-containing protein [Streptomyces sp. 71268]WEV27701.1 DUF397 domain-containing protein [Streptomyces sp. 71268]